MLLPWLALNSIAAPVLSSHECALLEVTHTNLSPADAEMVRAVYSEVVDRTGAEPAPIAQRLLEARGGFWDAYFMGASFSYSVYCSEYVELASESWNVLLCRESDDTEALDCGTAGLTLFSNGTLLSPSAEESKRNGVPASGKEPVVATPALYYNYVVSQDERPASEAARMPVVVSTIATWTSEQLQQPMAADSLRRELERALPWAGIPAATSKWNVLIEKQPGGHYYYSEEQFNLVVKTLSISVAIFDRRCHTLQQVDSKPADDGG